MVIGRALDADDVSKRRGKRVGILRHHANPRTNSRMYCIVHGVSTYRRNNEGVVSSQSVFGSRVASEWGGERSRPCLGACHVRAVVLRCEPDDGDLPIWKLTIMKFITTVGSRICWRLVCFWILRLIKSSRRFGLFQVHPETSDHLFCCVRSHFLLCSVLWFLFLYEDKCWHQARTEK